MKCTCAVPCKHRSAIFPTQQQPVLRFTRDGGPWRANARPAAFPRGAAHSAGHQGSDNEHTPGAILAPIGNPSRVAGGGAPGRSARNARGRRRRRFTSSTLVLSFVRLPARRAAILLIFVPRRVATVRAPRRPSVAFLPPPADADAVAADAATDAAAAAATADAVAADAAAAAADADAVAAALSRVLVLRAASRP